VNTSKEEKIKQQNIYKQNLKINFNNDNSSNKSKLLLRFQKSRGYTFTNNTIGILMIVRAKTTLKQVKGKVVPVLN
jgi:hypothetical protein